ncbi:MAG: repressor LexA [Chloroflexi bacterium]|nr:repressor LexA [Chloroflexota bacterium]
MKFLTEFQEQRGYSPSIREIGKYINVESTSLVDYYLEQLCQEGYIERDKRVSRSIRVLRPLYQQSENAVSRVTQAVRNTARQVSELLSIPVWGRIGASLPVPMPPAEGSYFDPDSTVEIARSLLPAREKVNELFALEVSGHSMIDAMVNDGDIVIMKRIQRANNGDMVAVWLEDTDETTLKYFYNENGRVRLQPANPTMEPIIIDNPARVQVQGKVVMIVRRVETAM